MPKITTPAEFMERVEERKSSEQDKLTARLIAFVEEWLEDLPDLKSPLYIPPARGSEDTLAIVRDLYEQAGWNATAQMRQLHLKLPGPP